MEAAVALERTTENTDGTAEKVDRPSDAGPSELPPPPDRPGAAGTPSRAESRTAARRAPEQPGDQQPAVAESKDRPSALPGQQESSGDRGGEGAASDEDTEQLSESQTSAETPPDEETKASEDPSATEALEAATAEAPSAGTGAPADRDDDTPADGDASPAPPDPPAKLDDSVVDTKPDAPDSPREEQEPQPPATGDPATETGEAPDNDEDPRSEESGSADPVQAQADSRVDQKTSQERHDPTAGGEDSPQSAEDVPDVEDPQLGGRKGEGPAAEQGRQGDRGAALTGEVAEASDGARSGEGGSGGGSGSGHVDSGTARDALNSDRSAQRPDSPASDEVGSWRGDGGQYLNAEENLATDHALDRIRGCEPRVTDDLNAITMEVSGGELTGLEYRLKGEERFKEKVASEARDKPEQSVGRIAEAVPDAVRYTFRFDKDDYVQGCGRVQQRLEARGYALVLRRNSWDSPDYKGINSRWRTPDGQLVEVQFHTPESFAAKQETHGAYEKLRAPGTTKQERRDLDAYQREVTARVPVPDEVNTIADYREGGY
jgi:hypothetical protein